MSSRRSMENVPPRALALRRRPMLSLVTIAPARSARTMLGGGRKVAVMLPSAPTLGLMFGNDFV
eukprot:5790734-Prymnesium_polylepis.2